MKIIIEHLDPEIFKWSFLEYRHICEFIGRDNLIFTNVKKGSEKIKDFGEIHEESIKELFDEGDLNNKNCFGRMCILDPKAKKTLCPEDAKEFDSFLFGGVLGNHPMDGRTEKELSNYFPNCEKRKIGDVQMSTDTAVLVTKKIIVDQIPFDDLEFQDEIEVELDDGYTNILPYRYLAQDGGIVVPKGLYEYLKYEDETNQM